MNNIARKLIRDSIVLRNWAVLSKYSTAQSYVNALQDTSSNKTEGHDKNNVKSANIRSLQNVERNAGQNIVKSSKNMHIKEAIKIMNRLYDTYSQNKELCYEDLKNSNEFLHVCKVIQENARALQMYDVINVLRILLSLNIPPETLLIQTLLQLIRVSVNDLSIGQIMVIHHALYKAEQLPLIQSLLVALEYAFKEQAKIELNSESNNLLYALKFCCVINDTRTKQRIFHILCKNERAIDLNSLVDIYCILCTLPKLDGSTRIVLYKVMNKIMTNCNVLKFKEIERFLYHVSMKCRSLEMDFYNEEIIDVLCTVLLNMNTTFHQDMIVLRHLNRMNFTNTTFLENLSTKCIKDSNDLKKCSLDEVNQFIKAFIIADYTPQCWLVIQTMLKNYVNNMDYSLHNSASVAFSLLSLDCYCPELIEKVFALYRKLPDSLKEPDVISATLKLYWCTKLLYPAYNTITIDENELKKTLTEEYKDNCVPSVMESLKKVVGGDEYMKSGLRTRFGQFIDHVVVLQPDRTFMNISNCDSVTVVEELASLSNCKKILFLALPKHKYSINKGNLLATTKMQLKAIETLPGFHTFVINTNLWEAFSSKQKISHLHGVIKSICDNASRT